MDISKHVVLGKHTLKTKQICMDTQWLPEFTMVKEGFEWRNTMLWGRRCSEFMGCASMRDGSHPLPSQGSHAPKCDYLQHAYLLESLCCRPTWPQLLKFYSLSRFLFQFQPCLTASPFTQLDTRSPASDLQWHFIYFVPWTLVIFALFLALQTTPGKHGLLLTQLLGLLQVLVNTGWSQLAGR